MVLGKGPWSAEKETPIAPRESREKPALNALIGRDCRVSGKLYLQGAVQIDGNIEGELHANGELTVGETAKVDAKIVGTRIKIYGQVNGDIESRERLELHAGARVIGNIVSPSLIIYDGVIFEGHCSMKQSAGNGEAALRDDEDLLSETDDEDGKLLR